MAERFFKSAINYFSGSGVEDSDNELVGKTIQCSEKYKFVVKKVLGEGGFGYVFFVQDVNTGKNYALKRLCVDSENVKAVKREIDILKKLNGHPHIVQYVTSSAAPASRTAHGNAEFMIVTELCAGGSLVDVVNGGAGLSPVQVLRVFHQVCLAVRHMHSLRPAVIHRDLKIENVLLDSAGRVRLCDLGSATTEPLHPDASWTHNRRGMVEEEIQRNTTPMYRSPEMIDLYSNHPINEKADIWALGCLLCKLCYCRHPFEDAGSLRILNANYSLPQDDSAHSCFHGIIKSCLKVDPLQRPSVEDILEQLQLVAMQCGGQDLDSSEPIVLAAPVEGEGPSQPVGEAGSRSSALQKSQQQAHQIWGRVKGGAGNLFKSIKDTSSKVISSVGWGSGNALDLTYVTSRILVMPLPGERMEEVRSFLDSNHPEQYLVFNLSGKSYDTNLLHDQVADFDWPLRCSPGLERLVDLCRSLDSWLRADGKNVIVLHCDDGRLPSGSVVAAYLVFTGLFTSPLTAYKLFNGERCLDGNIVKPPPSHVRYVGYVSRLVARERPHSHCLSLTALRMTTVPRMDKQKQSCRPYVEVWVDGTKVYTSVAKDNLALLRDFPSTVGSLELELGVRVKGNVQVQVHHVKSVNPQTNTMAGGKMFQIQFHTGFVSLDCSELVFSRSELDGSLQSEERYPAPFFVGVSCAVLAGGTPLSPSPSWQNLPHPRCSPLPCFLNRQEEGMVGESLAHYDQRAALHTAEQLQDSRQQYHSVFPAVEVPRPQEVPCPQEPSGSQPLFPKLNWAPDHQGYSPYISQEEESSSLSSQDESSDEAFSEIVGSRRGLEINDRGDLTTSAELLHLDDSPQTVPAGLKDSHSEYATENGTNDDIKEETADLIGLGTSPLDSPYPSSGPGKSPVPSFDPFASTSEENTAMYDLFSAVPLQPNPGPSSQAPLDPFTNPGPSNQAPLDPFTNPGPSSQAPLDPFTNPGPSSQAPLDPFTNPGPSSQAPLDPFTNLGSSSQAPLDPFAGLTAMSSNSHNLGGGETAGSGRGQTPGSGRGQPTGSGRGQPTGSGHGQPTGSGRGQPSAVGGKMPYESVIGGRDSRGSKTTYSARPVVGDGMFRDLLGDEGFSSSGKPSRSLKEMKQEQNIEGALDPETARIKAWAESKEGNIRFLLTSLPEVLWEGESRWRPLQASQLMHTDQVKKYFRKACLSVYPDKNTGTPHETLAKAIFLELNEAYSRFEDNDQALRKLC